MPLTDPESKALLEIGFFKPVDAVFLGIELVIANVGGFWWLFGHPEAFKLMVMLVLSMGLHQVWMTILIFRCMSFVVKSLAAIQLMPETAARMAILYQTKSDA